MSSTASIYDDPAFLKMVMREFKGKWSYEALRLTQPGHPDHPKAKFLLMGFKAGIEFAVNEELRWYLK